MRCCRARTRQEQLRLPVVLRIIADALAGLGAAHELRDDNGRPLHLVHRDVSPHNVLVGCDGVARLTDFGVAKAEDRLTHTRDGQIKGKLAYMAPEQAANGVTDPRSDLFSMGVILWECVTGQRLFRADNTGRHPAQAAARGDRPAVERSTRRSLRSMPARQGARTRSERALSNRGRVRASDRGRRACDRWFEHRCVRWARTVKHHAATKLKRDKKLIDDALRQLRPDDIDLEPEVDDELSAPSSTDISVVSGSLSGSKESGVFAQHTQPGNSWAVRPRADVTGLLGAVDPDHLVAAPTGRAREPAAAQEVAARGDGFVQAGELLFDLRDDVFLLVPRWNRKGINRTVASFTRINEPSTPEKSPLNSLSQDHTANNRTDTLLRTLPWDETYPLSRCYLLAPRITPTTHDPV